MKMLTRGKSEILKLLRVPRGSVRGKCGRRKGADGASPSKIVMGLGSAPALGAPKELLSLK